MILFGKEIGVKDYDCSYDPKLFKHINPMLNLYIQAQEKCNAKCDICNTGHISTKFNFEKFETIVSELCRLGVILKTSITGGEPLLDMDRVLSIVDILRKYPLYVALNTNAYDTGRLACIYDVVDFIYVSRHHYINSLNDEIMGIKTPDIAEISPIDVNGKISMNCVLQKGYIDNANEMKNYMDLLGKTNIRKVRFISLYGLTVAATNKMIDVDKLIDEFSMNTNSGLLHDKKYCSCMDFIHISNNGMVINGIIKYNRTNHFDCCRQLVYDGENLYDGFEKKQIII